MKIIYNNLIPFRGFRAMMLFGVIFARKSAKPLDPVTLNHELIHAAQAKDCCGWLPFYLIYIYQWILKGYRHIPFEIEAYYYDTFPDYLDYRVKFKHTDYL